MRLPLQRHGKTADHWAIHGTPTTAKGTQPGLAMWWTGIEPITRNYVDTGEVVRLVTDRHQRIYARKPATTLND